jgi:hypothetical protein
MNEKIRDFERQSGLEIYGLGKDRTKWKTAMEKYTELVVKECMSYMKDGDIDFAKFMIKRNFGVEE